MTDGFIEPLIWGTFGGLLSHLLQLVQHAKSPAKDRTLDLRDKWFWIGWGLLGLLGGAVTFLSERCGFTLQPLVAANIGASAPLIAEKLLSTVPAIGKSG
jgi:hypothetical protein